MPVNLSPVRIQLLALLEKLNIHWPINAVHIMTLKANVLQVQTISLPETFKEQSIQGFTKPDGSFFLTSESETKIEPFSGLFKQLELDALFCDFLGETPVLVGVSMPASGHFQEVLTLICTTIYNLYRQFFFEQKLNQSTERSRQVMSEVSVMHEISRSFESANTLDNLLNYIVEKSRLLMRTESASLMLRIPEKDELEFKVVIGPKSDEVKPFRLPMGKGISGWVAQNQKPILIPDAYKDPRFDPTFDKKSGYRTRSILCVPMIHKKNTIGVMTVLNRTDNLSFTEDDKNLMLTFASQAALAIENARLLIAAIEKERLDKELQLASEIQNLLLPQQIPDIPSLDICTAYLPCKEVSGDFYDIIPLDNDRTAFVVADVAGKGIPAAMLVSTMQATLSAYLEENDNLVDIVEKLNLSVIKRSTEDQFITFFIGIYNNSDATFTYVNAGHNPPVLLRNNETVFLQTGGLFLGYMPWQYESASVDLSKDDVLTLYTDGLVEAMNEEQEEFSEERLQEVLNTFSTDSAENILSRIKEDVNTHIKQAKLEDDFTLIVIKKHAC